MEGGNSPSSSPTNQTGREEHHPKHFRLIDHRKVVSIPYTTKDLYLFQNEIGNTEHRNRRQIYYTLDGTEPDKNALLYRGHLKYQFDTHQGKSIQGGYTPSNTFRSMLQKPDSERHCIGKREQGVVYTYHEGFSSVADLLKSKVVKGKLRSPPLSMQSVKTILDLPFKDYYGFRKTGCMIS